MELNFSYLWRNAHMIVDGVWLTVILAVCAISLGYVFGVLLAVMRRSQYKMLRLIAGAYIEVVRNTPLLVQVFLLFFGLSILGLKLPAMVVAIVAMVLNTVAYTAEILRAGFDAIKPGQWEAAESLGFNRAQTYWYVALLPATEKVYPSLSSQFVLMMLATSITSQISVDELTAVANFLQAQSYRPFETYIVTALLYIALSFVLRTILWLIGRAVFPRLRMHSA